MKTVLITGTSKGIGLETALTFGRNGYRVFATMRSPDVADDFRQKIADESSGNYHFQNGCRLR